MTGKFPFPTRRLALRAARRKKYPIHPYICPGCHAWHVGGPQGGPSKRKPAPPEPAIDDDWE